eukprot:4396953-Amphidinium_carterae.2
MNCQDLLSKSGCWLQGLPGAMLDSSRILGLDILTGRPCAELYISLPQLCDPGIALQDIGRKAMESVCT